MTQDIVQQIESNIAQAKEIIGVHEALIRLESNRDFRKVIKEGYLEREAIRLVHLKADPACQSPAIQAAIIGDISAIGGLLQYFRTVAFNASVANKAVEAGEAERDDILFEEANK